MVDLNSSQFILIGKQGCLNNVLDDISFKTLLILDVETLTLSAISFSDCFLVSSTLICNSELLEIFLYLSTKFVSAKNVLWQCLQ